MTQEDVNAKPQFLELDAPEMLTLDQNLFEQPPFDIILQDISAQTGVATNTLRGFLTSVSRKYTTEVGRNRDKQITSPELSLQMQMFREGQVYDGTIGADFNSILFRHGPITQAEIEAIRKLGVALGEYPYWSDYIRTHSHFGYRTINGTPIKSLINPEETYAKWVVHKLSSRSDARLLGIHEIFPQDFSVESPTQVPLSQTTKGGHRRWQILKASNLIPEK